MCSSKPGYNRNESIPMNQARDYTNLQNSYVPTERKWIGSEIINNPRRIRNDSAFANEILPKKT